MLYLKRKQCDNGVVIYTLLEGTAKESYLETYRCHYTIKQPNRQFIKVSSHLQTV